MISKYLKQNWSPEQILGRLKKKDKIVILSHETIYKYTYKNQRHGGKLFQWLRHKNKKYKNRSELYRTRGQIKNRVCRNDVGFFIKKTHKRPCSFES